MTRYRVIKTEFKRYYLQYKNSSDNWTTIGGVILTQEEALKLFKEAVASPDKAELPTIEVIRESL